MAFWWLAFNFLSVAVLAFYSMLEMACVSFNKVRLEYYVSKGDKRALWISKLLKTPSSLFGTTLIGVNVALFVGSECAREFHIAIGLDPNWTPLTQVFLVVIFGELAPMFAARHYPEHVAMLGIPIIYASSKIMAPFIWILTHISQFFMRLIGYEESVSDVFLSQEELQKILEEHEEDSHKEGDVEDVNLIAANIFRIRGRNVSEVMLPFSQVPMLASHATIAQMSSIISRTHADFIPIYRRSSRNVVGIANPRDALRAPENAPISNYIKAPWFISYRAKLTDTLKKFRTNKENVAIVLDERGSAIGVVTLDSVLDEIFGRTGAPKKKEGAVHNRTLLVEKTLSGEMTVEEFEKQFHTFLSDDKEATLSELVEEALGHPPQVGDSVSLEDFELTVKETSLLDIKTLLVNTKMN